MKNIHTRDGFEKESSWISISSLKKAANISAVIETFHSENSLPVNISEMTEWKNIEKLNDSVTDEPLKFLSHPKPAPYSHLLRVIFRLNEEIQILSQQLKSSNQQIEHLSQQVSEIQQESAIKLQTMQEKHEKRLKKSKDDIDFLLKDLNMKSVALMAEEFIKKHNEEIETVKENYEMHLEQLKVLHENEIIAKEVEGEKNLYELKKRFFKYLAEVEKKFKHDLSVVRCRYGKEMSLSKGETEDGLSDDETLGFDFERECYGRRKKSCVNGSRLAGISICEMFDRFSCGSGASTRRDSR